MTHDELLAKIDGLNYLGRVGYISSIWNALHAVVELHRESVEHKDIPAGICVEDGEHYPCPTIQAIEKELS